MNKESLIMSSKPIEVSEQKNHKIATFLISVLDEYNENNVLIEKSDGEKHHKSIIGMPVLAYLEYSRDGKPSDFGGHELRSKIDDDGNISYYFATIGIGSVLDSWIEKREVAGYEGLKDVILVKTKLWTSRYPEYFDVLDKLWQEGNVDSSWEISVDKSERTPRGKKLQEFEFIGNTILGREVLGAVKSAGMLEVAENNIDSNLILSQAFVKDMQYNKEEEGTVSKEKVKVEENEVIEVEVSNETVKDVNSIMVKLDETVKLLSSKDVTILEITKERDALKSEVETKTEALVSANEEISNLKNEVSELTPFKEKVEAIEQAEKEETLKQDRETLRQHALKSKRISQEELDTSEEIKEMIESLDKSGINNIIAERLMNELETEVVEVSDKDKKDTVTASIMADVDDLPNSNLMSSWLSKK